MRGGNIMSIGRAAQRRNNDLFELTGDAHLAMQLSHMTTGAAGRIMKPAVREAMKLAKQIAVRLVPQKSGALKKAIARTVKVSKRKHLAYGRLYIRKGFETITKRPDGTTKVNDPRKYAHLVELGTRKVRARSFLRTAVNSPMVLTVLIRTAKLHLRSMARR